MLLGAELSQRVQSRFLIFEPLDGTQHIAKVGHVVRALAVVLLSEVQPEFHLDLFEESQSDGKPVELMVAHREQITESERDISAQHAASSVYNVFPRDRSGGF